MGVIAGGQRIEGAAERIRTARVALADGTGAAGMLSWQNPEEYPIIIQRLILDITTPATGAAIANFGSDADGTGTSSDLIDGVDIGTAAGVFDNIDDQGVSGGSTVRLDEAGGTTDYLTGSAESDPADLVGYAYIQYWMVDD